MKTTASSQTVHQDFLERLRVASCDVESLLAFGEEKGWCFIVEKEKGFLERPIQVGTWRYQEYDPNSITLPLKAQERLDAVLNKQYPIRQIIYGNQIVDTPGATPQPKPSIQIPDRAVKTATSLATAVLTLTAGAVMVAGYAFLMALQGIDPKLIVVPATGIDDEKDLPWVCLISWEEEPENS